MRSAGAYRDRLAPMPIDRYLLATVFRLARWHVVRDDPSAGGIGIVVRTWDEASARWLDETRYKATSGEDASKLKWLATYLAGMELGSIGGDLVARIGRIKADATTPATANRYLALIRAILRRAREVWEWIERAPRIVLYPERHRRIRWLSPDQVRILLDELPPHQRVVVLFALATGLRQGNVLALEWSQVDIEKRLVWIHADQAKARRAIRVPLSETALQVLQRCRGDHPSAVFTYRGRWLRSANTRAWRHALKRSGIENFRWHDLRHTWASWHAQHGTPLYVLQELGSWQSEAMVKRYAHLTPCHYAHHAETVSQFLLPLA